MRISSSERHMRYIVLTITLVILFGLFGSLRAQDTTPTDTPVVTDVSPTTAPTDNPTVPPTVASTDVPTLPPTEEPPTAAPTDIPAQETPIEVSPTDNPTDIIPTLEATPSPTVPAEPPVFNFADGTSFEARAASPLIIQGSVSDSIGMVTLLANGSAGVVELTAVQPTESVAPFNTLFTISYTPALDFAGQDSLTLIAANQAGIQSTIILSINVVPLETATPTPTPTPTLEPTPLIEPMKELIIRYDPAASEEAIQTMLASIHAVESGRIPQIGAMRILVPESISRPDTTMAVLQSSNMATLAGVVSAERNSTYHLSFEPTDPKYSQQWGLSSNPGGIYASYAWDIATKRGYGIIVAVIDSGVDLQHPDLIGQIASGGWDFFNDDNSADDDLGHGTHVAGIIASRANNGIGTAGVAFAAKVLPIKSCGAIGCPMFDVAAGIIYAVDKGVRIINLSLGGDDTGTLRGAVDYALSRNVVVVAAAGNTGCSNPDPFICPNTVEYPAAYPGVISVGAHNNTGTIWDDPANEGGSAHNSSVLVSAPGVNILSTWPVELDTTDGTPDGYTSETGTSMATAYVSGTTALLMNAKVAQTPATVRDALICGAEDAGTPLRDDYYGYGRLRADLSLNWNYNTPTCKVTVPNDNFESATLISRLPFAATQPVSNPSVTEQLSDPLICGSLREQTLWYRYKPSVSGYYQFTTLGSSYNTALGVFRGGQGVLTSIGCVDMTSTTPMRATLPLDVGQTYYIVVGTNAGFVDDQVMQLRINSTMNTSNLDYQETSPVMAYIGTWSKVTIAGASNKTTQQTSDTSAIVAFSFRGTQFDYVRTVGPDRGAVQVYINNAPPVTVSNRAAVVKANQVEPINVPGSASGSWNTVYIQRDATVPGVIDIDRIRAYDFDSNTAQAFVTAKVDDRSSALRYSDNDWTKLPGGTFNNTFTTTSVTGAKVTFRTKGSALTIFRTTGPGTSFADMQVTIDNVVFPTVSNTAPTLAVRPYTIDNLTASDHVVVISNVGNKSGTIQLDAVQAITLVSLKAPTMYDERVVSIAYRGSWTDAPLTTAFAKTIRNLDAASEASFQFVGNSLCVGYQLPNAPFDIYIDGTPTKTITENSGGLGVAAWCFEADKLTLLADTLHYARIVVGTGTTATTLRLDYLQPQRFGVITAARKIVQQTDASFVYATPTNWLTLSTLAVSPGGFKPQGGSLKETQIDNTSITFYINGTGLILYTASGITRGCWETKIDGIANDPIDLYDDNTLAYRPVGYGISNLTPGIHRIQLISDTDCGSIYGPGVLDPTYPVDFDAVRVFP